MSTQLELDNVYMNVALQYSKLSKANRAKVGACIVTENSVMLAGFNGTPSGFDNRCEDSNNETLPEVLHAELNCILKAAREGVSVCKGTLYVTLSPCIRCAAMMAQSGIKRVVYKDAYRDTSGLTILEKAGIIVDKF